MKQSEVRIGQKVLVPAYVTEIHAEHVVLCIPDHEPKPGHVNNIFIAQDVSSIQEP